MTLTDAGPLVALVDRRARNHQICLHAAAALPDGPMLTTWPCFTEAMHLLGRSIGQAGQEQLWELIKSDDIEIASIPNTSLNRLAELMRKYADQPMDLADASLIELAERVGMKRLFTLDGDFRVYCLRDGAALEVVP